MVAQLRAKFIAPASHLRRDYDAGGEFGYTIAQGERAWFEVVRPDLTDKDVRKRARNLVWGAWRRRWYRFCRWVVSLG